MNRYLAPIVLCAFGLVVLIGLGVWQLQRLEWKQTILDEIDARVLSDAVPLPAVLDRERDRYLPVKIVGRFTGRRLRVLTSIPGSGPGALLVEVFETNGRRVLVDQGYRSDTLPAVDVGAQRGSVLGNVHWPDEVRFDTPDPEGDLWFARDADAMADALGTEPVLIIAREVVRETPISVPRPVDSSTVPNDHLQYAVTWFSLAAVWLGMTLYWVSRIRRMAD